MRLLIKGGRIIDPGHISGVKDILIEDGRIVEIEPNLIGSDSRMLESHGMPEVKIVDATGKIITPGLIDMHVHLREPGHEYKETIASGCLAAASGGFTAVCSMPNTNPVNDTPDITEYILKKGKEADKARVYPVAAISRGLKGKDLSGFVALKDAGAIALSDDGNPVMDTILMRRALEKAKECDLTIISHSEDAYLSAGGAMNEGAVSRQMGVTGIPNAAESIMVMRDIALSELTDAPLHIAHVSTRESVHAIREAKKRGVPVTAETAPHYFILTDEDVLKYGTHAKMNPPLRSKKDQNAIRKGLADGTIDVIATDHAPHSLKEKAVEFEAAANGITGLETAVSLSMKLVEDGVISMDALVEKMAKNPARILGLPCGLSISEPADITIIDPDRFYTADASHFHSLSRNTPFEGWQMTGKAVFVMVGGKIVFNELTDKQPAT